MSCVFVVCVLLLVSQVEMIPVNPVQPSSVDSQVGQVDLASADQEMKPMMEVNGVLSRVRRAALASAGDSKCSNGMTELWYDGPCVTCKKYMEVMDTDECGESR